MPRLAVAGLGYMGATHLKALEAIPGATLTAVISSDERKRNAPEFAPIARYPDLESALSEDTFDALDLCTPTHLHENAAIRALECGKHVLVEKPMALDSAACDRMIEAARRNGRILMVAQVLRFHPAYNALAKAMENPSLGRVRRATFRRRTGRPERSPWMSDPSKSGGGILDLLIHDADMVLKLFGMPKEIAATGYSNLPKAVDLISAQCFYEDELVVEILGGWHHASGFPFSMEYTVAADGATLNYHSEMGPPKRYNPFSNAIFLPFTDQNAYASEIEYFLNCVESGNRPERCTPESSAEAVRLIGRMLEARERNGERVSW